MGDWWWRQPLRLPLPSQSSSLSLSTGASGTLLYGWSLSDYDVLSWWAVGDRGAEEEGQLSVEIGGGVAGTLAFTGRGGVGLILPESQLVSQFC